MKILADASLPNISLLFKEPFCLTLYTTQQEIPDLLPKHDILICRSTLKVTEDLLANSPIQCVATASSGIDHIDSDYLKKHKIALFDAKGCNAAAVADYVVATLACLYIKNKVLGNKAGVIGVGEVGSRVVARLRALGFDVICFDPLKEKKDKSLPYCSLADLATCDVICVHANLHHTIPYPSFNLLDADVLATLKRGTVIINAARGGVLNEPALLNQATPLTYCTDVYSGEPDIDANIVAFSTLCTPHIAGHTIEAKTTAVMNICQQIHEFYGVSMPIISQPFLEKPSLTPYEDWKNCVLSLYNPLDDTRQLKSASDKKLAFLTQRRAHQTRHDFAVYDTQQLHQSMKTLLGQ